MYFKTKKHWQLYLKKKSSFISFKLFKWIFISSLILLFGWFINLIWYKPFSIDRFYYRMFVEYGMQKPEQLSEAHLIENYGFKGHNADLNDISENHRVSEMDVVIKQYDMLLSYKRSEQTENQLLSTDIIAFYLQDLIYSQEFGLHDYPLNHINGVHVNLPLLMIQTHNINSLADAENYLSRLSQVSRKFNQLIENILIKEEYGRIPPKPIINKMIGQIDSLLVSNIYKDIFYKDFQAKIHKVKKIPEEAVRELSYEIRMELENGVKQSYILLKNQLNRLRPNAPEVPGVVRYDDGILYYSYLLNKHLTTEVNTEYLRQLAEKEIARLKGELNNILRNNGFGDNQNYKNVLKKIYKENVYPNTASSKLEIFKSFVNYIDEIDEKEKAFFHLLPKKRIKIQKMPSFFAPYFSNTLYYPSSIDQSRPSTLFVNLSDTKNLPGFMILPLVVQNISGKYAQDITRKWIYDIPAFRKQINYSSFEKGWEYYILNLSYENDFFEKPLEKIGALQLQLLMNAKLISDIKIHMQGQSRNEAIEYIIETTGLPVKLAEAAVDEIIVKPAKACAFILGFQKITELKEKEQTKKGERFSIKDFHQQLLKEGEVPIHLLDKIIN